MYVSEDFIHRFFLIFGWGEFKTTFHKLIGLFGVYGEIVCLRGETGVFCDVLGHLQREGLLKGESFSCCFAFSLCCWFVYIDERIVAIREIEASAYLFRYWVLNVFNIVFCEDFFYGGTEPAG